MMSSVHDCAVLSEDVYDACMNNTNGRINIVTGHSLGGALAKIVSQRRSCWPSPLMHPTLAGCAVLPQGPRC